MKEKDLPIDRTKHRVYSKDAKKCVWNLLTRCYDEKTAARLWERIQLQYAEFLMEEPALKDLKITKSIYDPILIFAWYKTAEAKPPREVIQEEIYRSFFGSFDVLGKIFDLNRKRDSRIANRIFRRAYEIRVREEKKYPASFQTKDYSYEEAGGIVRYCFTQCPNAEFAKRHHMEDVLPFMCNCDQIAMQKVHACLIRENTCITSDVCDYCICGDRSPLAGKYELCQKENGLLLSVKKEKEK